VAEVVLLLASTLELTRRTYRLDRAAGTALLLYAGWTGFATALSAEIARRNPYTPDRSPVVPGRYDTLAIRRGRSEGGSSRRSGRPKAELVVTEERLCRSRRGTCGTPPRGAGGAARRPQDPGYPYLAGRPPSLPLAFHPDRLVWINQVERWFGLLTDQLIRRGVHRSVVALENDVRQ
jgi:hypothetical protein